MDNQVVCFNALARALLASGNQVLAITNLPPTGANIVFDPSATDQQKANAMSLVAGWDWSDSAVANYQIQSDRFDAKFLLTSTQPFAKLIRSALIGLFNLEVETRNKVNEVVAFANTKGGSIVSLTNPTLAQVRQALQNIIDSGQSDQ